MVGAMSADRTNWSQAVGSVTLLIGVGLAIASNCVLYAAGATAMAATLYFAISLVSYWSMTSQLGVSPVANKSLVTELLGRLIAAIPTSLIGIPVTALLFGTASWLTGSLLPVALAFKMSCLLWAGMSLVYSGDALMSSPTDVAANLVLQNANSSSSIELSQFSTASSNLP